MSGNMIRDTKTVPIPGFAPSRIVAVTTSTWTPEADDRAFCVASDTNYQIDGTGTAASIKAGAVRVIVPGQTFKFTVGQNIEVM